MLLIIQNDHRVPPGVFGEILREMKIPFRTVHPYAGDALPALAETPAVLILGGYMGVHDEADYPFLIPLKRFIRDAAEAGTPLLGSCLGGQLLAQVLGGEVRSHQCGEKGLQEICLTSAGQNDPLFAGLPATFAAFEWHNDSFTVPPGALHLAASAACPGQAFRYRNAWGVQFHPEVDAAIIESWSTPVDPQGEHLAAFAAGEIAHAKLAGRLLQNFLGLTAGAGKNLALAHSLHPAKVESPLPPS
jgi:GMP synthase-like glutamine amidotransferase